MVKDGSFTAEIAMERLYAAVTDEEDAKHSFTAKEAADVTMRKIIADLESSSGTGITGITYGIPSLDKVTGGKQKGDLIIVAGRPSMGKTSADISFQLAGLLLDAKIGFISAEMPVAKVTARMMAAKGKFNLGLTKTMPTDQGQQAIAIHKLKESNQWYAKQAHYTNDKAGISLAETVRQARQWKRLYDIDELHVDYTQFLTIDADSGTKTHEKVGMIVKGLKRLAKELDIVEIFFPGYMKVNSIENQADDIYDMSIERLFAVEPDAKEVIKKREIYQVMETATDKCEDAANVIESIMIKYA
jgi:replicative DNA helicase